MQYNEIDKISPVSALPLIQFPQPGPPASIAGGLFILGTYPREIITSWLMQPIFATLVRERIIYVCPEWGIVGTLPAEGYKMSQITQLGSGAIWICNKCHSWWGSQIGKRPSTKFLTRLDTAGLLPSWEMYRGWKLVAEQAPNCLECGNIVAMPALQSN